MLYINIILYSTFLTTATLLQSLCVCKQITEIVYMYSQSEAGVEFFLSIK